MFKCAKFSFRVAKITKNKCTFKQILKLAFLFKKKTVLYYFVLPVRPYFLCRPFCGHFKIVLQLPTRQP